MLRDECYLHFLILRVSIRILCTSNMNDEMILYAERLLRSFVEQASSIYGETVKVYNVHLLVHLADEVWRYATLDSFEFSFRKLSGAGEEATANWKSTSGSIILEGDGENVS